LAQSGVVELTPATALVGHDGCADARLGDYENADVLYNDYSLIEELRHWDNQFNLDRPSLRKTLEAQGDDAAAHLATLLREAFGGLRAGDRGHTRSAIPRGRMV